MKNQFELGKSLISCILILAFLFCNPISAVAQSQSEQSYLLATGTPVVLRVNETTKFSDMANTGSILATVESDVYSSDGSQVMISAGTPAVIDFESEPHKSWGKPGRVCLLSASTHSVDNKKIMLRMSACKNGDSAVSCVVILSVLLFPVGLFSGFIKGATPRIFAGTTYSGLVMQDVQCIPATND